MSMPVLPEPNKSLTKQDALNMILSSIALEETALSHIINAEGEKIQHILKTSCSNTEILAVNKSVDNLLETIMQNQIILKSKMESALEHMPIEPQKPKPCPCSLCCDNCCNSSHCRCCDNCNNCHKPCKETFTVNERRDWTKFVAICGKYCCYSAIKFKSSDNSGVFELNQTDSSTINFHQISDFSIEFAFEFQPTANCENIVVDLQISTETNEYSHSFCLKNNEKCSIMRGELQFSLPANCGNTSAIFTIRLPSCVYLKCGEVKFAKFKKNIFVQKH